MVASDRDGEPLSHQELAELESRVSVVSDRIVMMREVSDATPQSVSAEWERVRTLAADWDSFVVVADLRAAKRPSPDVRRALTHEIDAVNDKLLALVAFTETNMALRAAARFVLGRSGVRVEVLASEGAALAMARAVL